MIFKNTHIDRQFSCR